jgi:signal transduction histidine kinase
MTATRGGGGYRRYVIFAPLRLVLADTAAGLFVMAAYVGFAGYDGADGTPVFSGPGWVGWLVAACVGLPLAVRRLFPLATLGVVVAGCAASALLDITREPFAPAALALYAVGLLVPRERSIVALGLTLPILGAALFYGEAVSTPSETTASVVPLIGAVWLLAGGGWAGGAFVRARRGAAALDVQRDTERARAQERLRIAREVHDIVSHNLSLIALQAGVAHHVADERPDEARAALASIEATSRGALAEMRGMLGVLRSEGERAPMPGLADLPRLAQSARDAGVTVELRVSAPASAPDGVELAVYRIVQEALTNVAKHAAPATCAIDIHIGPIVVEVSVVNPMVGPVSHPGHGLMGVRERVAAYGGEVTAGPVGGDFVLRATIPCRFVEAAR